MLLSLLLERKRVSKVMTSMALFLRPAVRSINKESNAAWPVAGVSAGSAGDMLAGEECGQ